MDVAERLAFGLAGRLEYPLRPSATGPSSRQRLRQFTEASSSNEPVTIERRRTRSSQAAFEQQIHRDNSQSLLLRTLVDQFKAENLRSTDLNANAVAFLLHHPTFDASHAEVYGYSAATQSW